MSVEPSQEWSDHLRRNIEIGVETDGHHYVWLEALGLYGFGDCYGAAKRHVLEQVAETIEERRALDAREAS